jgi:hypothetical protein
MFKKLVAMGLGTAIAFAPLAAYADDATPTPAATPATVVHHVVHHHVVHHVVKKTVIKKTAVKKHHVVKKTVVKKTVVKKPIKHHVVKKPAPTDTPAAPK